MKESDYFDELGQWGLKRKEAEAERANDREKWVIQRIEGLDKSTANIAVGALEQVRQKDRWLGKEYR